MISASTSAEKMLKAIRQSDERLTPFRQAREFFLGQYRGRYYNRKTDSIRDEAPEPLNTLFSAASILVPHLAFQNPRNMVTSEIAELRGQAELIGLDMDRLLVEIDFARTLREVVTDSLFGCGIIKTGIAPGQEVADFEDAAGYLHDNGQAYADAVDLDDYIVDPLARCREQATFEGHKYRLPLDYIKDSGLFEHVDGLKVSEAVEQGRAEQQSRDSGYAAELNELIQYVDLHDVWVPYDNVILTLPSYKCGPAEYIRKVEYDGPERGPFEMLGYQWLPSNVLPIAPISIWFDLHLLLNKLAAKLGRRADRDKNILIYDKRSAEDAKAIVETSDGESVGVADVDRLKELNLSAGSEKLADAIAYFRAELSTQSGNMDLVGGLSAQSKTLGQDQMLMGNAGLRLEDMRGQVVAFVKNIVKKLAWYRWTDPLRTSSVSSKRQGVEVSFEITPEMREGDFLDYNYDIDPYSMQARSPEQQYQKKFQWITEAVLPIAQLGAPIGQYINPQAIIESMAQDLGIVEADEFILPGIPLGAQAMPEGAMGGSDEGDTTVNTGGGPGGSPPPESAPVTE